MANFQISPSLENEASFVKMFVKRKSQDDTPTQKSSRRRKESQNEIHVKGQLSNLTHILHTEPESMFLEICSADGVKTILVEGSLICEWVDRLTIGQFYVISHLKPNMLFKEKLEGFTTGDIFQVTKISQLSEGDSDETVIDPEHHCNFMIIKGTVTNANDELGLYRLNGSVTLVVSTLKCVARVPPLKEGDEVTIYNAHEITVNAGKKYIIMCCRSLLCVDGKKHSDLLLFDPFVSLSPTLKQLFNHGRSCRNVLWAELCQQFLERNFSDEFLEEICISGDGTGFRSAMLQNIINLVCSKNAQENRSLLQEVLDLNHRCDPLLQKGVPFSLLSISEVLSTYSEQDDDVNTLNSPFWANTVLEGEHNKLLVCYVCVKNNTHRLALKDSSGFITSVVTSSAVADSLSALNGKFVLVWTHKLIVEKFIWTAGEEEKCQFWKYLVLCEKSLSLLNATIEIQSDSCSTQDDIVTPRKRFVEPLKIANSQPICQVASAKEFWSQLVFLQHKPSICVQGVGKAASCSLLVKLIGKMVPESELSRASYSDSSNSVFITLQASLLACYHFMEVNKMYEIRLPKSCSSNFFQNKSSLSYVSSLFKYLPTIQHVIIPDGSEIRYVNSSIASMIETHDCYSVSDAITKAPHDELICVIGFISSRIHEPPRYEREHENMKAYGFGTPDCQIMVLYISDKPPSSNPSQTKSTAVYLTNWNRLQYPLAIVPGAKVIIRFVRKVLPRNITVETPIYLRASVLSSFEIIDFASISPSIESSSEDNQWGPRHLMREIVEDKAVGWVSISMMTLNSLMLLASCKSCNKLFSKGSCSFAGCLARMEPVIFSQAVILSNDYHKEAIFIFIPNQYVQKVLKISEDKWKLMCQIASRVGELRYHRKNTLDETSDLSLEERIFHHYCQTIPLGERRVHMLCRKFRSARQVTMHPDRNPIIVIYCMDVKEVEPSRSALV